MRSGGGGGAGPVHIHLEKEDRAEDQDHRDGECRAPRPERLMGLRAFHPPLPFHADAAGMQKAHWGPIHPASGNTAGGDLVWTLRGVIPLSFVVSSFETEKQQVGDSETSHLLQQNPFLKK